MTTTPVPFLVIEDFLTLEEHSTLVRLVAGKAEFAPATACPLSAPSVRRSC